ncbi:uncharacterized protein PV09_03592 [Verruconis gallopava]|uniref:RRM domain-containing protein n=1 Tax=Verruconis gallopava TaxID=253628 RepID=A0A0D2AGM1_9PEZI|nr:uncharacterized protein PV09_03592 [Verruconis gallopava]KIW05735.1 hypothetical protein PV09_03592 [Verruconis gallopava]
MSLSGQSGSNTPTPTPQPHASLPARPTGPLPSLSKASFGSGYGGDISAQGQSAGSASASMFRPRAVAASAGQTATSRNWQQPQLYSPATVSAPAISSPAVGAFPSTAAYPVQPDYNAQQYANYYSSAGYGNPSPAPAPQIKNPFAPPPQAGGANGYTGPTHDPEYEAQMQQWQAAYMGKDDAAKKPEGNANLTPIAARPANIGPVLSSSEIAAVAPTGSKAAAVIKGPDGRQATVVRSGGGKTWTDDSLLEWDPSHPRLFIGNLAGEVTDDSLYKAFSKYPSIVKTKVVRDRRTTKSKGYGFVSFRDADDYLKAFKEMQGKYIGSHPVLIKKSNTEIKVVDPKKGQNHQKGGKNGKFGGKNRDATGAHTGAGVKKNQNKTRDGMVLLG